MISSLTTPKQIRDMCLFLGTQLENGPPLSDEQRLFIAKIFKAIGNGEDPNLIFGQQRERGKSKLADQKVEKIGVVIRSVATDLAIAKREGTTITITAAIRMNLYLANSIMGYRIDDPVITEAKVRRWWDTPKYKHFKNPYADSFGALP